MTSFSHRIRQLTKKDRASFRDLLHLFGRAFEETETYSNAQPSDSYLDDLLDDSHFIALAAFDGDQVVGGLTAYLLRKFERERSEIFIYDLAVEASYRRQGIANALIEDLRVIARKRGAYLIVVQADLVDPPAIALYRKWGHEEKVLQFDIVTG